MTLTQRIKNGQARCNAEDLAALRRNIERTLAHLDDLHRREAAMADHVKNHGTLIAALSTTDADDLPDLGAPDEFDLRDYNER